MLKKSLATLAMCAMVALAGCQTAGTNIINAVVPVTPANVVTAIANKCGYVALAAQIATLINQSLNNPVLTTVAAFATVVCNDAVAAQSAAPASHKLRGTLTLPIVVNGVRIDGHF